MIRSTIRTTKKAIIILATSSLSFQYYGNSNHSILLFARAMTTTVPEKTSIIRIFCYGDSLTAGTSPPDYKEYPYAPHLEATMNQLQAQNEAHEIEEDHPSPPQKRFVVRWIGLPGWTAKSMVENQDSDIGLRSAIKKLIATTPKSRSSIGNSKAPASSSTSYVIILAGTNDLGYEINSSAASDTIFKYLTSLHNLVLKEDNNNNIRTIALSIPPSSWQYQFKDAKQLALSINNKLKQWCENHDDDINSSSNGKKQQLTYYIEHPMSTRPYEPKSDSDNSMWSSDGLHFSADGYKYVGESLAKAIFCDILSSSNDDKE